MKLDHKIKHQNNLGVKVNFARNFHKIKKCYAFSKGEQIQTFSTIKMPEKEKNKCSFYVA